MAIQEGGQLVLGFATVAVAAMIANQAVLSAKQGDLLAVEGPSQPREETAAESAGFFIAGCIGLLLGAKMLQEMAEDVGPANVAYATAAGAAVFGVLRVRR